MNKKLVLKNYNGMQLYCVLSSEIDFEEQLHKVFQIDPNHGISVQLMDNEVVITDYYHDERIGELEIISYENCDDEICYELVEMK